MLDKCLHTLNQHPTVLGWFTPMPQQDSHTTSSNPKGIFRTCPLDQASVKVCLHKSTLQSSNIPLCQACSAVCKEGKRTELVRVTDQITALKFVTASLQETRRSRLVSLSQPHGFCPLPVPCRALIKSAVSCKNAFVCIWPVFLGWRGEGRKGLSQHSA